MITDAAYHHGQMLEIVQVKIIKAIDMTWCRRKRLEKVF